MILSLPFPYMGGYFCTLQIGYLSVLITEEKALSLGLNTSPNVTLKELTTEEKYASRSYRNISQNRKFLNLLNGGTSYGTVSDIALASTILHSMLKSIAPASATIDSSLVSLDTGLDYVLHFCHRFRDAVGMTLTEANARIPDMLRRKDKSLLRKLVKGTVFERDPMSALPLLRNGGITLLWEQHHLLIGKATEGVIKDASPNFLGVVSYAYSEAKAKRRIASRLKKDRKGFNLW